jgi:hypothetical protein
MGDYTYILYLTISNNPYANDDIDTLFLGASDDPFDLYYFAFDTDTIEREEKWILLEWLNKVETLSEDKKIELKDRFRHPKDNGDSFSIGRITLHIKKIRSFDYVEPKNKVNVLEWIYLVEHELTSHEKYDLEYAFMHNPEDEFSYPIKHMELHIKKIKQF